MYKNAIEEARKLAKKQTQKNQAPSWLLTELAQKVGIKLAREYDVNAEIVQLALYLEHIVFDAEIGGEVQKNHPELSAQYIEDNLLLEKWNVPAEDCNVILEAIRAHHQKVKSDKLIVEVIKNAECQKFITVEGALIWLHELGLRGYDFEKSKELVFYKMNQKKELLTLEKSRTLGERSCKEIEEMFNDKNKVQELKKLHQFGLDKASFGKSIENVNIDLICLK